VATPIHCPHCRHEIAIKDARPGRFRIACPGCGEPFALTVPDGPGAPPVVATIAAPPPAAAGAAVDPPRSPALDPEPAFRVPRRLGGYRVGRPIGASGSVGLFQGRGRATGRDVALAILRPRWAADAPFVARFAREAFAAGQLRHPNLAHPVDLDVAEGLPFAASDALGGAPLSGPSGGRKGLDRTARVAAILHAARALGHAHEQHVYHRDLSLDKIRVDAEGLVRLVDLGVNLAPDSPEAPPPAPIALAPSPAPAPEPRPSAADDDLAALGRALRSLIGGEQGDRAIPPGLASVARRMAGEGTEPRFADLGAATRALEAELGVSGPFAPGDAEAAGFEDAARAFDGPPMARIRPMLELGFAAILGLFVILALAARNPLSALGFLAFGATVAAALAAFRAATGREPVADRARELILGGDRGDLLTALVGAVLVVGALWFAHLLVFWIFLTALAVGLAAAGHFAVDRPLEQARAGAVDRARDLIRGLRRQGVDEDSIRRFACRQPGPRWEEFFEALFGYEAMRAARDRWGPDAGGRRRPRFAPGRDPIVDAIDARLEARRRDRDRTLLHRIEERGLEARGVNLLTARRRAARVAEAMVRLAAQYRHSADGSIGLPLQDALLRATEKPEEFIAATEDEAEGSASSFAWREALGTAARVAFGPRTRFLAGVVLLAGWLVWLNQNKLVDAGEIKRDVLTATSDREQAVANAEKLGRKFADNVRAVADAGAETRSLEVPYLAPEVARRVDGFGLGPAGLILVLSSFFRGVRFAAFAVPGALIAAIGPRLIDPASRPLGPTSLLAMAIGGGLFALGVVFGRSRDR